MVEYVEDFPPQLQRFRFAEPNVFSQSGIKARRGRTVNDVTRRVADAIDSSWRVGEASGIEELRKSVWRPLIRIANHVRPGA